MKKITILTIICVFSLSAFSQNIFKKQTIIKVNQKLKSENHMYAKINTSKGDILIQLEYEKTPLTVANFVALSEGEMKNNHKQAGEPYYDGLKFHRVIDEFMVQGGCPLGSGSGDPGYKFADEFHPDLKHDKGGVLSMANSGPGTNGSQFFITHKETPWLDGKHTVFGHVIEGMEIVNAIVQDDVINTITIIREGSKTEAFNAVKVFNTAQENMKQRNLIKQENDKAAMQELTEGATKTKSGLAYKIIKKGNGHVNPTLESTVTVHYTGKLIDGTIFDSSVQRGSPASFGVTQVIQGWIDALQLMKTGSKWILYIPADLAYGTRGSGQKIEPNATLIFEVELLSINS